MNRDIEVELKEAIERILQSPSRKKLIVAGPGTGKTTLFQSLLKLADGNKRSRLVLTFINNLKDDLEEDLSDLASVFTLHGYCQSLLRKRKALRGNLSADFRCLPELASLIKRDWEYIRGTAAPHFVGLMRNLDIEDALGFYFERSDYYDAVDFDDSVFRVYEKLRAMPSIGNKYDLILIDEYQDFNRMEAAIIDMLAEQSPIVIAGDDDQALYSQLRGSSWEFIRSLHKNGEYEIFELPFCMRCPEVIVAAVNDTIDRALALKRLQGRIENPYRHYAPVKGTDSQHYPKIDLVHTTVQRLNANYFGQYIVQAIKNIPPEEIAEAKKKGDPAVLVIGSNQYRRQIERHLIDRGYAVDTGRDRQAKLERESGLQILCQDPKANLGWRVMLDFEDAQFASSRVREAHQKDVRLVEVISEDYSKKILNEVRKWVEDQKRIDKQAESGEQGSQDALVKITSFEGAKGLSAQHVFIVGMHEGEIPRDTNAIQDIEICRFVVGLTRTRKKCTLMHTGRFADEPKRPSAFLTWIKGQRYEPIKVDAMYWKKS